MTDNRPRGQKLPRSKRRTGPGAPPGSIIVHDDALPSKIDVFAYGPDGVVERDHVGLTDIEALLAEWPCVWINVTGLGSADIIQGLGDIFGLHSLALEDVINVHQRAKVEDYEDVTFIVARMIVAEHHAVTEQVSMFLGDRFVLTFQEHSGDCFAEVRDRLRRGKGRVRQAGVDYLAYALLDAIIDGYFKPLERYGDLVEVLEERVIAAPSKALVGQIHDARRDLFLLRKTIWSLREMAAALTRDTLNRFGDSTRVYLRDCYDHAVQLLDMTETYRDIAAGLFELYLSTVSNRMNEIMKVLTIIATIFMPMAFVTGVYGMNFQPDKSPLNMPELSWYWGYPYALGLMAVIALGMLFMFWRKRWIGGSW